MQTPRPVDFAKELVREVGEDAVPDLAAGLAYRFLFALFPFAIFLAALSSFVAPMIGIADPTSAILDAVADNLPPDVAAQIRPQLDAVLGRTQPGLLSIGAVAALWAAQGAFAAVIKAMNLAYDVEESRGFLARTGLSLLLTLLASAGILLSFAVIVGGAVITREAAALVGISGEAWRTLTLLRYPLVLALVALAIAVLFHFGPNVQVSFRWSVLGGSVFAVTWVLATLGFGLYLANFASYSNTYGALGGVVILLLWFYLTALLLLVAAEITALAARAAEPERVDERRRQAHEGVLARLKARGRSTLAVLPGVGSGAEPAVAVAAGTEPEDDAAADDATADDATAEPADDATAEPEADATEPAEPDADDRADAEAAADDTGGWAGRLPAPTPARLIVLGVMGMGVVAGALLGRMARRSTQRRSS